MNERIRELINEATSFKEGLIEGKHDIEVFDKEKFAELIVRECCIALNPMLRDMISRGQGVDMIKLHFGMNPKEITTAMLDTAIDQMAKQIAEKKHDS
tara:strand:+ start:31 stop:324 length:294 start_codon:yes stop_codon:yes gene_type:complete